MAVVEGASSLVLGGMGCTSYYTRINLHSTSPCMPVRSCLYWLWMGDGAGRPERLRAVYGKAKFEIFLEDLSHSVAELLPSLNLRGPDTRVSCFDLSYALNIFKSSTRT